MNSEHPQAADGLFRYPSPPGTTSPWCRLPTPLGANLGPPYDRIPYQLSSQPARASEPTLSHVALGACRGPTLPQRTTNRSAHIEEVPQRQAQQHRPWRHSLSCAEFRPSQDRTRGKNCSTTGYLWEMLVGSDGFAMSCVEDRHEVDQGGEEPGLLFAKLRALNVNLGANRPALISPECGPHPCHPTLDLGEKWPGADPSWLPDAPKRRTAPTNLSQPLPCKMAHASPPGCVAAGGTGGLRHRRQAPQLLCARSSATCCSWASAASCNQRWAFRARQVKPGRPSARAHVARAAGGGGWLQTGRRCGGCGSTAVPRARADARAHARAAHGRQADARAAPGRRLATAGGRARRANRAGAWRAGGRESCGDLSARLCARALSVRDVGSSSPQEVQGGAQRLHEALKTGLQEYNHVASPAPVVCGQSAGRFLGIGPLSVARPWPKAPSRKYALRRNSGLRKDAPETLQPMRPPGAIGESLPRASSQTMESPGSQERRGRRNPRQPGGVGSEQHMGSPQAMVFVGDCGVAEAHGAGHRDAGVHLGRRTRGVA